MRCSYKDIRCSYKDIRCSYKDIRCSYKDMRCSQGLKMFLYSKHIRCLYKDTSYFVVVTEHDVAAGGVALTSFCLPPSKES